jgi:predicted nucleic acid-binding protein
MLIDTDVLIWYMYGNENAYNFVEQLDSFSISVVTYIELIQGMQNKQELKELRNAIRDWNVKILYITEEISIKAMFYVERHYLSHSLQLADSMIAATAIVNGMPLCTANNKHYKIISQLDINKFSPK